MLAPASMRRSCCETPTQRCTGRRPVAATASRGSTSRSTIGRCSADAVDSPLRVTTDLRRALAGDEIVPYFHPIVDLSTGDFTKLEVLVRWLHPHRGPPRARRVPAVRSDGGARGRDRRADAAPCPRPVGELARSGPSVRAVCIDDQPRCSAARRSESAGGSWKKPSG